MTNNFDEFENNEQENEHLHEEGDHVQATGFVANLTNAWRSKPVFKLFVLMVVVAAVVAASVTLFSDHGSVDNSRLVTPPNMNVAPGGPVSPYMKQQTDLANDLRSKQALQNGTSSIPTPTGAPMDISEFTEKAAKDNELNELKSQVEMLKREQTMQLQQQRNQPVQQQVQVVQPRQAPPFDGTLAGLMQRQMTQLIDSWSPTHIKQVSVSKEDNKTDANSSSSALSSSSATTGSQVNAVGTTAAPLPKAFVPSGTVSYAQLLTEANSDVPGPILAQIVSGPLAGARAIGQFKVTNAYIDFLTLQFNIANLKGKEYTINAVALDPDTTLAGMATEVDQRYFTRVILPAGASFLQGLGQALGQTPSTVTTNGTSTIVSQGSVGLKTGMYQGLAQGAQTASQFLQTQGQNTKPLVVVAAGTPMGLFFVTSVYDPDALQAYNAANNANGYGSNSYGANGYGANGYANMGMNANGLPGVGPYGNGNNSLYGNNGAQGYPGNNMGSYGAAGASGPILNNPLSNNGNAYQNPGMPSTMGGSIASQAMGGNNPGNLNLGH